jgi:hypothetical protein
MLISSSILFGFIRLCLITLLLFYLNNRIIKKNSNNSFLRFITKEWFKYGSLSVIILFILVLLGIYNLINFLLIITVLVLMDYIGIKHLKNPIGFLRNKINEKFFKILKKIEQKKSFSNTFRLSRKTEDKPESNFTIIITICIIIMAFLSRYFFYVYDTFLLSDLWLANLEKINKIDLQQWFDGEVIVNGEIALINLYSKLVDISPESALESAAIIETTLLGIMIFWTIRKITNSQNFAGIIAFFAFVFLYTLSPIEIHFLLQSDSTYVALTFALPMMVYVLKPELTEYTKINYFISFVIVFIAIGLIDLFTLLIIIPPFLVITLLFVSMKNKVYSMLSLGSYILGVSLLLMIYYLLCIYNENDFGIFLQSSLISITSFTYMPNLAIPFDTLLSYYQIISLVGIIVLPFLIWIKKQDWRGAFIFLIYFNVLAFAYFKSFKWIDHDTMLQTLSVFIPIMLGVILAIIVQLILVVTKNTHKTNYWAFGVTSLVFLAGIIFSQKNILKGMIKSDRTPRVILSVYDDILDDFFPYTYAVVNDNATQTISENSHFFINYTDFLYNYMESDSIYHANKKNPKYFIKNPKDVIPKSILVFVYDEENKEKNNIYSEQAILEPTLMEQINALKAKGRAISIYYQDDLLRVYQIENEPNQSKIDDLIF